MFQIQLPDLPAAYDAVSPSQRAESEHRRTLLGLRCPKKTGVGRFWRRWFGGPPKGPDACATRRLAFRS